MLGALTETRDLYLLLESANKDPRAIVFYSEKDIYFQYFDGYIRFLLEHSDLRIYYITSDDKDPVFKMKTDRFRVFYLNRLAPKAIENLKTKVIVMTVPGLQNSFLKRSPFDVNHVFICHSMASTHFNYEKEDLDYFDTIFCVGKYQVDEIRAAEEIYGLRRKTLVECGYWWIEHLYREREHTRSDGSILIAPSWHPGNFFESGIEEAIPSLATLGIPVVLRPHPEFTKRFPSKIDSLSKKIKGTPNIRLETDSGEQGSVLKAALLITDWSNICYEFALGLERPVLFVNSKPRIDNLHYLDIPLPPFEWSVRGGVLGETIEMNQLAQLGQAVLHSLQNQQIYREKFDAIRQKYLFNWLRSAEVGGRYLESLYG